MSILSTYITGILLGLSYAAPIGAQNMLVIRSATTLPLRKAIAAAVFIALNDMALGAICFLGAGKVFSQVEPLRVIIIAIGSAWLFKLGIQTLRETRLANNIPHEKSLSPTRALPLLSVIASGMALTWLNPQAILDGSLILGSYRSSLETGQHAAYFMLGVCTASLTWFVTLTSVMHYSAQKFGPKFISGVGYVSSGILILMSFGLLSQLTKTAQADTQKVVKIAILDNLKSEKLSSDKYVDEYLRGIELATNEAKKNGLQLDIKTFFYDQAPLAVLKVLPNVLQWHPDAIIGPRSSDSFLLLDGTIKDTAVISPLASAQSIKDMNDNFYSISPTNKDYATRLVEFVKKNFKGRSITPITESDCKYCVNLTQEFLNAAKLSGIVTRSAEDGQFIAADVNTVSITKLLKSYQPNDLILMLNRSSTSGSLAARISNHLKVPDLIFLGGDGWGDWSVGYFGKTQTPYPYKGMRLQAWSYDKLDSLTEEFKKIYRTQYQQEPTSIIALISFSTVASITKLAKQDSSKHGILNQLRKKKELNESFGKPESYSIYEVSQSGEKYKGLLHEK